MLHISINGEKPFDIEADQDITITSTNPGLDKDGINRSFTLPFTLPGTARNQLIRKHSHRLDARKIPINTARIKYGPHLIAEGLLKQMTVAPDREEVQFTSESIDIWKALEKFKINEILGDIDVTHPDAPDAYWTFLLDPAASQTYTVLLSTGNAVATAPGNDPPDRDTAGEELVVDLNALEPGIAAYYAAGYLYLNSAVVNINIVQGWINMTLVSVVTAGEAAQANMALHITESHIDGFDTHSFPALIWQDLYGTLYIPDFEARVNGWANGSFFENDPYIPTSEYPNRWANTVIPFVRLPYILERIRERIGYTTWRGDFWESPDFQKLLIVNNLTLDQVYDDIYTEEPPQRLNGFSRTINFNNHVPEITAAAFIRRVCDSFNLELRAKENSLYFIPNINAMRQPPMNWRDKGEKNYVKETNYGSGWKLTYSATGDKWPIPTGQLEDITYGAGGVVKEIIPSISFFTAPLRTNGNAKMPTFQQQAQSPAINAEQKRTTMPIVWIFDRGIQATSSGQDYYFASHDNINNIGGPAGEWSLDIVGENGMYNRWHRGHIELSDSDLIKMNFRLQIGDIQQVMTWTNARARVYNALGEFTGVIKVVTAKMNSATIGTVSVEMLRQ